MSFYAKGAHEMKAAILAEINARIASLEMEENDYTTEEECGGVLELQRLQAIIERMDESGRTINAGCSNSPRETLPTPFLPRAGE